MTTLNLEFGFNVPRQLIYEALTDQKYTYTYSVKLCSILDQGLWLMPSRGDNFQCSMEG